MSTLSPDRWKAVSPYLDQALEKTPEERARLVASLRLEDPSIAADLQVLLDEHAALERTRFLEGAPAAEPVRRAREGQTVGPYTLLSPIGEGGMGTVWLARRSDGRYERQVAVKFPSLAIAAGAAGSERFKREGSILGRLAHPHIADLVDAGVSQDGEPFLVLEHVDGVPIDRWCDDRSLDLVARVRLFLDVIAAVAHAHANLIVHRDIKPSNVLVSGDGRVKLLDFGIAKLLEGESLGEARTPVTREGGAPMTPEFAAPEQLTGAPITTATDVYALGVLLYLLLTGGHPVGSESLSPADLVHSILQTEPPSPSRAVKAAGASATTSNRAARRATTPEKLERALRGDLDTIVGKAMKKAPAERYASVTALADDLRRHLGHEPIAARPDALSYRVAKFVRRNRAATALAAVAIAAAASGVAGTLVQARTAHAQRDLALGQLQRAEAINDLTSFLLSDAAPSGRTFTVNDLLARAERIIAREKGGNPANRVEILVSIGRQYSTQDEVEKSRRLLEEAYALSRDLPSPSSRAKAACALASTLSRGDDTARAGPLFEEGLAELPDQPVFALDRAFCLMRGSEVARNESQVDRAIELAEGALRVLRESPFNSELVEVRVLGDLAQCYDRAGRSGEALATFARAEGLLVNLGRDETQTAGTLYNNWALALDHIGRPLDAEKIFRRAIDISRDDRGEEAVSPMLLINYGRTLDGLNRLEEAADYLERGHAAGSAAGHEVVVNQSLLLLATTYRKQGRFDQAAGMLARVEPRLRRALPPGHVAFASVPQQRALIAHRQGDPRTALALANEAMVLLEASVKAGRGGAPNLPVLLQRRADIEIDLGQQEQAAADAARAVEAMKKIVEPGMLTSSLGRGYLTLGRALQGLGRTDEARVALRTALDHLRSALGEDHPETIRARDLVHAPAGPQ